MRTGGPRVTGALRSLAAGAIAVSIALVVAGGCGAPPRATATADTASPERPSVPADTGVTLAENAGPTLIVLSLDPAGPGDNTVRVDLRDVKGVPVAGAVRIELTLDAVAAASTTLPAGDRRGSLTVAHPGRADLRVTVIDGAGVGATATFPMTLPATRVPEGTLGAIDRAMRALRTLREAQTLSGGGPPTVYHFEYEAPDRVRYTTAGDGGLVSETRLIGRDRFDREGTGPWTRSDLGFPSVVPSSELSRAATRIRLIGREHDGAQELLWLAFTQGAQMHYRILVGADDHLVRRYAMMAPGHFMTGTYSDPGAALAIAAP